MSWKGFFLGLIGILVGGGVAVFGILAWNANKVNGHMGLLRFLRKRMKKNGNNKSS